MSSVFRTFKVSDPRFERDGLRHVTVKSKALRHRGDVLLFVPDGAPGDGDLPLVTLLHGVYGSHWSWALNAGAHLTAARLMEAGEIPAMVLAMPSDGLWGDGSGYLPHSGHDFEKWIVEEVPLAAAEATTPGMVDSPRFIGGLSMGGFGAMRLGARHGDRYRGISAHSSITRIEHFSKFVEEPVASYREGDEELSVLSAILAHRHELPALRFDCGEDDPLLKPNRDLHRALEDAGVEHTYQENPGTHEWPYWERHLEDTLRFFAGLL